VLSHVPKWTDFSLSILIKKGENAHVLDLRRFGHVMHNHFKAIQQGHKQRVIPNKLRRLIRNLRHATPKQSALHFLRDEWWQWTKPMAVLSTQQVVLGGFKPVLNTTAY